MDLLEIIEQDSRNWHKATRKQGMKGLSFEEELASAEEAMSDYKKQGAFIHLEAAHDKLDPEGDWEQRERWLQVSSRLHNTVGEITHVLEQYHWAVLKAYWDLGEDHLLTRRLEAKLCELEWSYATGQQEMLESILNSSDEINPNAESADHNRNISSFVDHFKSWSRCLDMAVWCQDHGTFYWAEVALRAALRLSGGSSGCRHLYTLEKLVALYEQMGMPWLAEREIRRALDDCLIDHGGYGQQTRQIRNALKSFLIRHHRLRESVRLD
jgi:hypothetical protein